MVAPARPEAQSYGKERKHEANRESSDCWPVSGSYRISDRFRVSLNPLKHQQNQGILGQVTERLLGLLLYVWKVCQSLDSHD